MSDTTDKLTENGILTAHPNVTLLDYVDLHGEPVHVGPDRVIFRDEDGRELNEWADNLGISRSELAETMHELARENYGRAEATGSGDPWSVADPIVFDATTFQRDGFQALALLLRRGCSPAEAVDWFATEDRNWSQSEWARWRGVSQQNVSGHASKVKEKLGE